MRIAIIGCGRVGEKRAGAAAGAGFEVGLCCDVVEDRARHLASAHGAAATTDWRAAAISSGIDAVIIATIHQDLAAIAETAARAGKHVLVEKPGARRAAELDPVARAAAQTGVRVRAGFNHRFHPAVRKAREIWDSGALGPALMLRARYGHGGRTGYEKEWRADEVLSGGGEAIDQGLHLIDLARWFLGEFTTVKGFVPTLFWDMPVEDNAFFLLRTAGGQVAQLHAAWTEWKNLFSLEIYGRDGKLEISGLGGSYGVERLSWHRMSPKMGPPETTSWEYPGPDDSWERELAAFAQDIRGGREPAPGIGDAQAALRIVEAVYKQEGRP